MIVTTAIDAFVKENEAGQNYGKSTKLWVNGGAGSDTRYAYVYFARPFEPGVTVLAATLRVVAGASWSGSQTLTAKRITDKWKESRIKWNDKPGVSTSHSAGVSGASLAAGDVLEIDVTEMLQDVSDGAAWYGVRLELSTDANRAIYSADHPTADLRPTLEVEWSTIPQAPTSLVPGGGKAISKTKPLLTWDEVDDQSSVQVQVSTSTDFSSPSYDSTEVAHTLSNFDLNAPPAGAGTFTALSGDDVRYWRVRVWNTSAPDPSEWSETQEFTRKTHGTLTITNPDVAAELPTFASLEGRWVAEDLTGLADGDPIPSVDDQSGNARPLTPYGAASGRRFTFKPGVMNGKAAMRSDGTDDAMVHAGFIGTFATTTAFTYWLVFRSNSLSAAAGNLYSTESLVGVQSEVTLGMAVSSGGGLQPWIWQASDNTQPKVDLALTEDVVTLVEVRMEGGNLYGRVNDGTEVSIAAGAMPAPSGNLILGAAYNGTASADADYAEFAISSVAESSGVRQEMRDYLMYEYGIS